MSGHQTAGQNLNTEIVNKLFGNVAEVTYWYREEETKLHSEINLVWIINHGMLAAHSVHNVLSSHLLSRNIKNEVPNCNCTCCFIWV